MEKIFDQGAYELRTALMLLEAGTPNIAKDWAAKALESIQEAIIKRREADEGQPVKGDTAKDGGRECCTCGKLYPFMCECGGF